VNAIFVLGAAVNDVVKGHCQIDHITLCKDTGGAPDRPWAGEDKARREMLK